MSEPTRDFPDDKTAPQRRKDLTDKELKDLKLAGGVEGGMQAGSGSPEQDNGRPGDEPSENGKPRQD